MKALQELVKRFVEDRPTMKKNNQDPRRMGELLRVEVDELVEALGTPELAQEIVDVVWFALTIANLYEIDLEGEFRLKAGFNTARYTAKDFQEGDYYEAYGKLKEEGKKFRDAFYPTSPPSKENEK